MKPEDKIRIRHMIAAAEEALSFIIDISETEFNKNRMLVLSIIKEIEIIGEAASKISEDTRLHHNNIPWQDIVDMRNRLIHGYFDVNVKLVWNTIKNDLPSLIKSLCEILRSNG
jgi:uncharacterized protein with HEPN domain